MSDHLSVLPSPEAIEALLAQTQCTECGYAGCRAYAHAVAKGEAEINRCAPGGEYVLNQLVELTGRASQRLPLAVKPHDPAVAFIIEADCIGCTLCIAACPADAIIGAAVQMHTVVSDWCTGCRLCLPVCPVTCIQMKPLTDVPTDWNQAEPSAETIEWIKARAALAKTRFDALTERKAKKAETQKKKSAETTPAEINPLIGQPTVSPEKNSAQSKKDVIQAALERARLMREKSNC